MTQSGCFRLVITVALNMGVTYGKLLFYHGISYQIRDKKSPMREYNVRIVYEYLNNPFQVDCSIPDLNLRPMPIDDSPRPKKIARYTSDPLPAAIYVASKNSVSTLTAPCDSPRVIPLTYGAPKIDHTIMRHERDCEKLKRDY